MAWLETLSFRRRLATAKYLNSQLEAEAREIEKLNRKYSKRYGK